MAVPLNQALRVGAYVLEQHLRGVRALPARADAGAAVPLQPGVRRLRQDRLPGRDPEPAPQRRPSAWRRSTNAARPSWSIAGGEPLLHREIEQIVQGSIARKKFVYLCTNALLLEKKMHLFQPSKWFTWSVHLDGAREEHDISVCQDGVYDRAVAAIRLAKAPASASSSTARCSTTPSPSAWRGSSTSDGDGRGRNLGLAGLCLRTCAGPGSTSSTADDQGAVPRHLRRDPKRQEVVVQPVGDVPRLPRRQPDVPLHAMGQSHAQLFRLAAALLSARRRLREDVQGADGRHRLGLATAPATTRSAPTAWCIPATRRPRSIETVRHPLKAAGVGVARHSHRWPDGAGDPADQQRPAELRFLASCRGGVGADQGAAKATGRRGRLKRSVRRRRLKSAPTPMSLSLRGAKRRGNLGQRCGSGSEAGAVSRVGRAITEIAASLRSSQWQGPRHCLAGHERFHHLAVQHNALECGVARARGRRVPRECGFSSRDQFHHLRLRNPAVSSQDRSRCAESRNPAHCRAAVRHRPVGRVPGWRMTTHSPYGRRMGPRRHPAPPRSHRE